MEIGAQILGCLVFFGSAQNPGVFFGRGNNINCFLNIGISLQHDLLVARRQVRLAARRERLHAEATAPGGEDQHLPARAERVEVGLELVEDRDPPALIWSIAPNAGDATQFMRFVPAYVTRMLQAHLPIRKI